MLPITRKKSDKLSESLRETLERANASNLQQAIRQNNEVLATLRHRVQLGEHLDKLKRHYRDLEKETVDLTTAEALPVDRLVLLGVPFIVGGLGLIYGIANVFGFTWLVTSPDPTWGMACILVGFMSLLTYYFGRKMDNGQHHVTAKNVNGRSIRCDARSEKLNPNETTSIQPCQPTMIRLNCASVTRRI